MKIVEGCKAVIVNSGSPVDGLVVTVLKFIRTPKGERLFSDDYWGIDTDIEYISGEVYAFVREVNLKRIDDNPKMGSWESLQDIFIPDRNVVY